MVEHLQKYCNVTVFKNGGRLPSWIFEIQIFNGRAVQNLILRHLTKFRKDRLNRCGHIAIFEIFEMVAADILDFQKFEILTVGPL